MGEQPLDVLVIDDSPVVREVMSRLLSRAGGIRPTVAADAILAMDKMESRRPHVILLDLTLPRMDGFAFLEHLMSTDPLPIVVLSGTAPKGSDRALRALELGAVDLIAKPDLQVGEFLQESFEMLVETIRAAATVRVRRRGLVQRADEPGPEISTSAPTAAALESSEVVVIGASTGGPEALRIILEQSLEDSPGIVIAQHMPAGFTGALARRLDAACRISVREAQTGDRILRGTALVCPGDHHVEVRNRGGGYHVVLRGTPPVKLHRPNIDILFRSAAKAVGPRAIGVLLTGMGSDGANGLAELKGRGGFTIAESAESAAVFGMPRQAIELGVVDRVSSRENIAGVIRTLVSS